MRCRAQPRGGGGRQMAIHHGQRAFQPAGNLQGRRQAPCRDNTKCARFSFIQRDPAGAHARQLHSPSQSLFSHRRDAQGSVKVHRNAIKRGERLVGADQVAIEIDGFLVY